MVWRCGGSSSVVVVLVVMMAMMVVMVMIIKSCTETEAAASGHIRSQAGHVMAACFCSNFSCQAITRGSGGH